ncbi:MAG: NADP-dependent oxidoreductase, partial [Alphaproteobacteria bacterium]
PRNYFNVIFTRATIQGFLVFHFKDRFDEAEERLLGWVEAGKLRHREDIAEGFEAAPGALMRLFTGANIGKQLVRVAPQ